MNIRHRIGTRVMDFAVDHLLRPDVAEVFREQLELGKREMIERQRITVQLREDLRDQPDSSIDPTELTGGGPGLAPHEAVDAALKTLSPEARKHIEWGGMRAAIKAAAPYMDAQRLQDQPDGTTHGLTKAKNEDPICSCGWNPMHHYTKIGSPERASDLVMQHIRHVQSVAAQAATEEAGASDTRLGGPGTYSPNTDSNQLPEGV
jgi:hypothetical protein